MLIGYVRVSTNDQNTDLQRNALQSANCEQIFEDKISGKTSERPGLKRALRTLKEGDTLVVWKLDRLGRSMRHLVMLTEELRERGVNFRSLTDSIDTSTPMGRFRPVWLHRNQRTGAYRVLRFPRRFLRRCHRADKNR